MEGFHCWDKTCSCRTTRPVRTKNLLGILEILSMPLCPQRRTHVPLDALVAQKERSVGSALMEASPRTEAG